MGFLVAWMVSVAFLILVGVISYPLVRSALRAKRALERRLWRESARKRAFQAWRTASSPLSLGFSHALRPYRLRLDESTGELISVESFIHKDEDYSRITLKTPLPPEHHLFFIEYDSGHHFIDSIVRRSPDYQPRQMKRYDQNFIALGDDALFIALLNEETRNTIATLVEEAGLIHLQDGLLTYERPALFESAEYLQKQVASLRHLMEQLKLRGDSIEARLLRNFQEDSNLDIRMLNLELLFDEYEGTPEASKAQAQLLDDSMPEIQLFGALRLGDEGLEVIHRLASAEEAPNKVRIRALKHLATHITEKRSHYAVQVMLLLLESTELNRIAVAPIAHAIQRFGGGLDEATCLTLLEWNGHPDVAYTVKTAAANLLARNGTVDAVAPLMPLLKSRNKELRKAADHAILQIQTRLGNVEAGRLSVFNETDGALSTTEDIGTLSLVESLMRLAEEPEDDRPWKK